MSHDDDEKTLSVPCLSCAAPVVVHWEPVYRPQGLVVLRNSASPMAWVGQAADGVVALCSTECIEAFHAARTADEKPKRRRAARGGGS